MKNLLLSEWASENPGRCGLMLADVSADEVGQMAVSILGLCADALGAEPYLREALTIGSDRAKWPAAHDVFDRVREHLLVTQRAKALGSEDATYHLIFLTENVMRVVYNATQPIDPFDEDSGAWVLVTAHQVCRCSELPTLVDEIWAIIQATLVRATAG